jgi:hypothetical protein
MVAKMEEKLIPTFSVSALSEFLAIAFCDEVSQAFEKNKVSGALFLKLKIMAKMVEAIGDIELQSLQSRVQESLQVRRSIK